MAGRRPNTPTGTTVKSTADTRSQAAGHFAPVSTTVPGFGGGKLMESGNGEPVERGYAISRRSSFGIEDTWELRASLAPGPKPSIAKTCTSRITVIWR